MKSRPFEVKAGSVTIEVRVLTDGRYRIDETIAGKQKRWTYADEEKARRKAREVAGLVSQGRLDLTSLNAAQMAMVVEALRLQLTIDDVRTMADSVKVEQNLTVREAIDGMIRAKQLAGNSSLEGIHAKLLRFLEPFLKRRIVSVKAQEMEDQLSAMGKLSPVYRKNLRTAAVMLFRWARGRGALPDRTSTEADKITKIKVLAPDVTIYAPEEFVELAKLARPQYLPTFAIGAFAGIRSEEISPAYKSPKRPLKWEDINWSEGHIDVHAHTTKRGKRRLVPMSENLGRWLHPHRKSEGMICAVPRKVEVDRIQRAGFQWKKNALRHSFGSYRVAQLQDMPQVAIEMGNSVQMIQRHYWHCVTSRIAKEWFALVP